MSRYLFDVAELVEAGTTGAAGTMGDERVVMGRLLLAVALTAGLAVAEGVVCTGAGWRARASLN